MSDLQLRFVGVELYFDDLSRAKRFYHDTLGLKLSEHDPLRYAKFDAASAFVCLERKGVESYPSQNKAVLFFEVQDLAAAIQSLGNSIVHAEPGWAVLHDPEAYNIVLIAAGKPR